MKLVGRYSITILALLGSVILFMAAIQLWQFDRSARALKALSQSTLQTELDEQLRARAQDLAGVLADNLAPMMLTMDLTAMYELLLPVRSTDAVEAVYVFDEEGTIVHDASRELGLYGDMIEAYAPQYQPNDAATHAVVTDGSFAALAPIRAGGRPIGGVFLRMSRGEIAEHIVLLQDRVDQIASERRDANIMATAIGALLVIILGVGLSVFAAQSLARPILSLSEQTRRIAAGDFDVDTDVERGDEIGLLAESLGDMGRELELRSERIRFLAYNDSLTGLPNRISFSEAIAGVLDGDDPPPAGLLLFVDLNRFKRVNDTLGHEAGDTLLPQVAASMVTALREAGVPPLPLGNETIDPIARWGGDDFAIFLDGVADMQSAQPLIDALYQAIGTPRSLAGIEIVLGASVGAAFYPRDGDNAEMLLKHADIAMYQAKQTGASAVKTYSPAMAEESELRLEMEADLRAAMIRKELRIDYEPVYDPVREVLQGFEAHLYWQHAKRGRLEVRSFMAIAESIGVAEDIALWVLDTVLADFARWCGRGGRDLELMVNLYSTTADPELVTDHLADGIERAGVDSARLIVQISEARFFHDLMSAAKLMRAVRVLGVQNWIDGFGSGYTSLAKLHQLTVDGIKFHRDLIDDLNEHERDQVLISAIIGAAHTLGQRVAAANVRSQTQLDLLRSAGCDSVQGPRLREPMSAAEVENFLREVRVA